MKNTLTVKFVSAKGPVQSWAGFGPLPEQLRAKGVSLRPMTDGDLPFLLALYCSFRAEEMARVAWTQAQKDAFLAEQFRLQHHHFTTHFPGADFWIVERSLGLGGGAGRKPGPIGRFYIDRSAPLWRCIELGFMPHERGRGVGGALLSWACGCARAAGAEGLDLHVMTRTPRAQALYVRLGFQVAEEAGGYRRMVWRP